MDYVLDKMKESGIPMTRENYLALAYFGNPPEHLTAEQEAELPPQFRQTPKEEPDVAEEETPDNA